MYRALLVLSLVACGQDVGFAQSGDHAGGDGPAIEVTPSQIDFGALGAGEVATGTFTVTNVGSEDSILEISEIAIGGEVGGFSILTEDGVFSLPGGASSDVDVAFSPLGANEQVADVIVASNDPDQRRSTVSLVGQGLVPELEIGPDPLDLGTTYIGCDEGHDLTLTNVGTDALVVDSIAHTGGMFLLTDANVLPLTLEPGAYTTVNIGFTPTEEGEFTGELAVVSNEPIGTRTATQTAVGAYVGPYEDTFEVPEDPPSDIVFFVDQSCSMDDDAAELARNFSGFISALSTYTSNWRIIVANADDGCNTTGILRSSTADYAAIFEDAVTRGGGDYTEAGLIVTSNAIERVDAAECNANFLRESALLHIIMVSDEPEQSPGGWEQYVDAIIAKKGDASLVKLSAVAGPAPRGCTSGGNSAEYGSRYDDAVAATGGEFISFCSDWATSVEALADASITVTTFELTRTAAPSTIEVAVNGAARTTGWTHDTTANSIVFEESQSPVGGDVVSVTYAGLTSCD